MNALVIDDSRTMRRVLSSLIGELGYETEQAENGQEALEVLEQIGPVDLVLVDWNMPVMNGVEFVRAVIASGKYPDTKLMMVTSETDMSRIVEALEAGAHEYLMKPLTPEALREKMQLLGLPCS